MLIDSARFTLVAIACWASTGCDETHSLGGGSGGETNVGGEGAAGSGAAGGAGGASGGAGGSDPCAGQELPACPAECPSDYAALCGTPCSEDGATCGNSIGDGMTCTGGQWSCVVHPPLGTGCNLVCQPDETDPCLDVSLPTCPAECASIGEMAGQPCEIGEVCGNEIGDGCSCPAGTWQCVVHPPLGPDCNLVCRHLPGDGDDPCAGESLPPCAPVCAGGFEIAGTACGNEGEECIITNFGDECVCSGGQWGCAVHPPLGPGCNLTCE